MSRLTLLTITLMVATPVYGAPLAPKKPSDTVLLRGGAACTFNGAVIPGTIAEVRVNPDGTATPGFTIPPGTVLVLDGMAIDLGSPGISSIAQIGITGGELLWGFGLGENTPFAFPIPGITVKSGSSVCVNSGGAAFRLHGFVARDR